MRSMRVSRRVSLGLFLLVAALPAAPAHASVTTISSQGSAPGQVSSPTSIAFSSDGNVLVGEEGNVRVQKLTPAGAPVLSFGSYGSGPGQFGGTRSSTPLWVAGGPDGSIYVGDPGNTSVSRFTAGGEFITRWSSTGDSSSYSSFDPRAVATAEDGDVFVGHGSRVARYAADGTFETAWTATDPQGRAAEVRDIAVGAGRVYVLAFLESTAGMSVHDANGIVLERWSPLPANSPGSLAYVSRLAADAAGNVYGASAGAITKFDPHGALTGAFNFSQATPMGPPSTWDPCSATKPYYESYGDSGWGNLHVADLAMAADGAVLVADRGEHRVLRVDQVPIVRLDVGPRVDSGHPTRRMTGQYIVFDASRTLTPFGPAPNRYEWDLDGEGTFERDTGAQAWTIAAYAQAGEHVVRVRATEPGGGAGTHTERFELAPSSVTLWPEWYTTGRKAKLNGAGAVIQCSKVLKYEWDLDGDGVFEVDNGDEQVLETVFREPGKRRVSLRVTRPGGRVDVGTVVYDVMPGPPPGPVGVTINDGAQFTNSPHVVVNAVWPAHTRQLFLSNDGGFKRRAMFEVAPAIQWRLDSSGPERLPKTVYLRFESLKHGAGYQDDIILDETDPVVTQAELVTVPGATPAAATRRRGPRHRLRLRARDQISGVARMQLTGRRKRPGRWRKFSRRASLRTGRPAAFVRVQDRAGNASRWRRVPLR